MFVLKLLCFKLLNMFQIYAKVVRELCLRKPIRKKRDP
jgi:hypothetical protein